MARVFLPSIAMLPFVHGIAFPAPSPTLLNPAVEAAMGWTPQPTPAPYHRAGLKRQDSSSSYDPSLCGWAASGASIVGCAAGRTCALYTAGEGGMAGCCEAGNTQDCGWAYDCVPYDAWNNDWYDAAYDSNSFVMMCTDSATPFCATWAYTAIGGAAYACVESSSGVVIVDQTFTDSGSSTYALTLPMYSGAAVTGWDVELSLSESDVPSILGTTSVASASTSTSTSASTSTSTSASTSTSTPASQFSQDQKKTPIAAIVGGVVGGVAVLALLAGTLIFLCLKRRKARQLTANQPTTAAQQTNSQPHQADYKPVPMQSPPHQQTYFAPQDQKANYQPTTHVHEHGLQSPAISSPSSPAPPYAQTYYAAPAEEMYEVEGSMAAQGRLGQQQSTGGRYEANGITTAPTRPGQQTMGEMYEVEASAAAQAGRGQQAGTFEMGPGK